MFDFVEQPVAIRSSEYPMLDRKPARVVVENGMQPVYFVQGDVAAQERPQSLLSSLSLWAKKKQKGKKVI